MNNKELNAISNNILIYKNITYTFNFQYKTFTRYVLQWNSEAKFLQVWEPEDQAQRINFEGTDEEYQEWVQPLVDLWEVENAKPENQPNTPEKIQAAKEAKLAEIKSISNGFRNINVNKAMWIKSSLGFEADADKDSQDNAYSLSKILETQEPGATLHYRDRNNEDHELNKDQLYTLYLEMKTNGVNLFNQKWALEEKVNNGQTVEEIEAIEVTFKMLDFTSGVPTNFK